MKEIKFVDSNCEQINAALNECQKGCRVRTMDYDRLVKAVMHLNHRFSDVPKKAMVGLEISLDYWAEDFPNAYTRKGRPESTQVLLTYKAGGWYVTKCFRDYTRRCSMGVKVVYMPDTVKQALIESYYHFQIC